MLRLLRRWLKGRGAGERRRVLPLTPRAGRSLFLTGRFKDHGAPAVSRLSSPPELGYRLYLPSGSARRDSLPLIVMLHGCKQDPIGFAEGTRMNALAEERRCAVLYPEQSRRSNAMRCWNWFEAASLKGEGEAAVLARLIEQVTVRRPIDPRRVHVVGMSAGGAMASILAVRHSRLFAACAVHSGLTFGAASSPMQALAAMRSGVPAKSTDHARRLLQEAGETQAIVPTLVIHGDRDQTVNPINAEQLIAQLEARVELIDPSAPLIASDELRLVSGGRAYRQQDYLHHGQTLLRKVIIEGLGHAWSGGDARHEFNDAEGPDASRLIIDFVLMYQRETRRAARSA